METELTEWQKVALLRGAKNLSYEVVCEIAEIVFRETKEIWAVGDALEAALKQTSDSDVEITIPRWVAVGAFSGVADLVERELGESKGVGKWAKVRTRRLQDRLHLIRTIKALNLTDKGRTLEEAYAEVAQETEETSHCVGEDAVKDSVKIIKARLAKEDARYYLPLSPTLRALFGDLGDFDSSADWPVQS